MIRKGISEKSPRNLLFIFQVLSLILLFLYQKDMEDKSTLITSIGLILSIYLSNYILVKVSSGDNYIFLIVSMLISIGIIMIYRNDPDSGVRQLLWIALGIGVFYFTYFTVKYIRGWKNFFYFYVIASYGLFLITFIFGERKYGAINWVEIAGYSFQPAEIIKILLIFILSSYYSGFDKFRQIKYSSYYIMAIMYSFIGLLFLQRDLGTAVIFYAIFIILQYIYEEDRKIILYNIGLSLFGAILAYFLFSHVRVRFQTWIDPWKYIDTKGYQITQSLFAIAEGGFLAKA